MTIDDFERGDATSTSGAPLHAILAVLPEMRQRRRGPHRQHRVDRRQDQRAAPRCRTARASSRWSGCRRGCAPSCAKDGVRVTTVCPGLMRTGSPRNAAVQGAPPRGVRLVQHQRLAAGPLDERRARGRRDRRGLRRGDAELVRRCRPSWARTAQARPGSADLSPALTYCGCLTRRACSRARAKGEAVTCAWSAVRPR